MTDSDNHHDPQTTSRDILAQLGPIDDLLGSVSYNSDIDGVVGKTQPLRTSARVFKKMKFDLCNNAPEKKEEVKIEEVKPEVRNKPLSTYWTSDEKRMFFEAISEYGKDFENIQLYISTRLKKKGILDERIKTRMQVRHFYYRTFNMLIRYIEFSEKIPKNVQELYTLINFGEWRRKIGAAPKKNWSKLNELIMNGSVSIRTKGKTVKVKTPMCKALRRLNQMDEKYDDLKLPTRVTVELKPKDMASFLKIQSIAQNPRLKMAVSLQKRLSSVISCVSSRWKSFDAIMYEKALLPNNATKECVPDQTVIDKNLELLSETLRLRPPKDAQVELPSIDISEYFTGQSICLNAFETRKAVKDEVKTETNGSEAKLEITDDKTMLPNERSLKNASLEEKLLKIEEIRKGWTLKTCESMTIGELYLMFGSDSKLTFEYNWDEQVPEIKEENQLSQSLKKLLSLAKLQYNKRSTPCTCGHVCGAKSNNSQFKRPVLPKSIKKTHVVKVEQDEESVHSISIDPHLLDNMQRLKSGNKARPKGKQLVVARKLVPTTSDNSHQIVSINIVPQQEPLSEEPNPSFSGLLSDNHSNSSTGISRILKESDNQWINTDVQDYSLSSLLVRLDGGPSKTNESSELPTEDISQLSSDMDAQLRTLLIEATVDYTEKFADLAAQVVDNKK